MNGYHEVKIEDVKDLRVGDVYRGADLNKSILEMMRVHPEMWDWPLTVQRKQPVPVEPPAEFTFINNDGPIICIKGKGYRGIPNEFYCKTFREVTTLSEEASRAAFDEAFTKRFGRRTMWNSVSRLYEHKDVQDAWEEWQKAVKWATGAKVETAPRELTREQLEPIEVDANEAEREAKNWRDRRRIDPDDDIPFTAEEATRDDSEALPENPILVAKLRGLVKTWGAVPGGGQICRKCLGRCAEDVQALLDSCSGEVRSFVPNVAQYVPADNEWSDDNRVMMWAPYGAREQTCFYTVSKQESGK